MGYGFVRIQDFRTRVIHQLYVSLPTIDTWTILDFARSEFQGLSNGNMTDVIKGIHTPLFFPMGLSTVPVIRGIVEHAADIMRQRHEKGTHVDVQKLYPWIVVSAFTLSNKIMRIGQRALCALFHRLNCERISQQLFSYSTQVDITSMALFGHTQDLTAKDENDIYPDFLNSIDMFTNHM